MYLYLYSFGAHVDKISVMVVGTGTKPVFGGGWAMVTRWVDTCTWLGSVGMYWAPPLSLTGLVPAHTLVVGCFPPTIFTLILSTSAPNEYIYRYI